MQVACNPSCEPFPKWDDRPSSPSGWLEVWGNYHRSTTLVSQVLASFLGLWNVMNISKHDFYMLFMNWWCKLPRSIDFWWDRTKNPLFLFLMSPLLPVTRRREIHRTALTTLNGQKTGFYNVLRLNFPNYPLVNSHITMERSTIFHGKTHYFYGHYQ